MKSRLARWVPEPLASIARKVYHLPADVLDRLSQREGLIPPRSMIFVGTGDFLQIGRQFRGHLITLADVQPASRVLDVGCGIGRMAIPLTEYLSPDGEYWGFDIVKKGIAWCQKHISAKFRNFHFLHVDVHNDRYNPRGAIRGRDFRFPFSNNYFDCVFLTSVFTHMLPPDVEQYLGEVSRVLRVGGKCLITFFILNEESRALLGAGLSTLDFHSDVQGCLTVTEQRPETAIAYPEELLTGLFGTRDLSIIQPIHYGSWCGRRDFLSYQDIVVAVKRQGR